MIQTELNYIQKIHQNPGHGGDYFAYMFSGFFVPYTSGKHWFRTYSDDASYVYLQGINNGDERSHGGWGTRVVDNGGLHGGRWRQGGHYNLTAGQFYPITIMFGENAGAFRMIYQYHVHQVLTTVGEII